MDVSVPDGRERIAWVLLGIVVAGFVVYTLSALVGAIVVGLFLYYATRPVVQWLDDRVDYPRVNATIGVLVVALPILFVLAYALVVGLRELDQFLAVSNLEQLRATLEPYLERLGSLGQGTLLDLVRGNVSRIAGAFGMVAGWLLRIFVAIAVAYYLLRDDEKIAAWFHDSFDDHEAVVTFAEGVDEDLTTLYTGNLLTIALSGAIAVTVFYGLGFLVSETVIQYPVLLGLVIGVSTLVPAVGMKIVYFPYTAYLAWLAWVGGGPPLWFPVVFFVVTLLVVDSFPDIFVRSYLSSGSYNMGLVMLAYVLGAVAFGWYGVFFAPLLLVVSIHFARDVLPQLV